MSQMLGSTDLKGLKKNYIIFRNYKWFAVRLITDIIFS
jgi:hypothetical protein